MEVSDIFVFSFFSKILWVLFFCICFQEEELNNNGNTYRRMTKPCKGGARTGWPQHVWALELKQWYPKILLGSFFKKKFFWASSLEKSAEYIKYQNAVVYLLLPIFCCFFFAKHIITNIIHNSSWLLISWNNNNFQSKHSFARVSYSDKDT